jgi:hypothetical protein
LKRLIVFALALALLSPSAAFAGKSKRAQKTDSGGTEEQAKQKKGPFKDWDEVTEEAEKQEGFFDVYTKDGKVMLAVPEDRLEEQFLMNFEIAEGIGRGWLIGGTMLAWEGWLVTLERHGNRIYLSQQPHRFKASKRENEPIVDFAFAASVLESAEIVSEKGNTLLIDVTNWFVSDMSGVGEIVRYMVGQRPGQRGQARFDKERSYLENVKVFPKNVNIRTKLTFSPGGEPPDFSSVPDTRYIPVSVYCVMAKLPENSMEPRVADDRVGYFLTVQKDFSKDEKTYFQRYARRWRLEPGKKRGDLYEPKQPIVYHLDPSIPPEYRPFIQAGIEEWNLAFEAAGFRNAIQADLLPRDADAEDIRYATIRWVGTDVPSYGAIGPSIVDPRTGEVLDADILFDSGLAMRARNSWRALVDPSRTIESIFSMDEPTAAPFGAHFEHAGFAEELAMQMSLVRTALLASGEITPEDPVPMEYVGEFLKFVTMHEVGHTLGLRHNFRGSTDTPIAKLHDKVWTGTNGVVNSVMEYPAPNIQSDGGPNGHYYTTTVGTYDKWAIAYGYTPDAQRAEELARQAAQDGNLYATDEDTRGRGALDPTVNVWDLGDDPLAWSKDRCELIHSLWGRLPQKVLYDNQPHYELTNALSTLLVNYARSLAPAVKYLGGQEVNRDHVGDPGQRAPFVSTPKEKQLEALQHIVDGGFSEESFAVPTEVLTQLGPNRWSHWGNTNTVMGRIDYPLHELVLSVQRGLLFQMTHPFRFARISDAEQKFGAANVLTIPEMMDALSSAVWSEVWSGSARSVPSMRRNLQRLYVDHMAEILTNPAERMPADARAVARMQLQEVRSRVDRALSNSSGLDAYTRAHLVEVSERLEKALDAGLEVEMLGTRG